MTRTLQLPSLELEVVMHGVVLILTVCGVERDVLGDQSVLQPNPRGCFLSQGVLL